MEQMVQTFNTLLMTIIMPKIFINKKYKLEIIKRLKPTK